MTDSELDRNAARRLAIIKHAQEVTGNVAMTCRYYGISRQVFCRWYRQPYPDPGDGQATRDAIDTALTEAGTGREQAAAC